MKRTLMALVLAAAPGFAAAQINFAPGPLHNTVTCAAFTGMGIDDQVEALQALPSAGDEIGSEDPGATEQWLHTVEAACRKEPGKLLADVAAALLGGD